MSGIQKPSLQVSISNSFVAQAISKNTFQYRTPCRYTGIMNSSIYCPKKYYYLYFQGSNNEDAYEKSKKNFVSALFGNWKIWTIPQLFNLSIVPVEYRVLFANMVAFFWNIYLTNKTASIQKSDQKSVQKSD